MCRWSLSNDVHVISSLEALGMILSAVGSLMTCQVGKAGKGGNVFQLASRERRGDDEMLTGGTL